MTLILHTFIKKDRHTFREHATWLWFENHEKEIEKAGWDIAHVEITPGPGHEYDYDGVIRHFWGTDDLLIFERDMVPTSFDSLVRLVQCPNDSCAIDYPLIRCYCIQMVSRSGQTLVTREGLYKDGKPVDLSNMAVCVKHNAQLSMMRDDGERHGLPLNPDGRRNSVWSDGTWEWADMAPLGLTRFRKTLMQRIPAKWPPATWLELDGILTGSLYLNGARTHVHMPWARHMRKKVDETKHNLVATIPLTTPVAYDEDLKPEYQAKALARFRQGFSHADRPLVEVP